MLYFIIRVLANALALAIAFTLLPGIEISPFRTEPLAVTYLTLGLVVGIVLAFVRPIIIILTARLMVRSMGLYIFVINMVLFAVGILAAPNVIRFRPPEAFWFVLGSLITALPSSSPKRSSAWAAPPARPMCAVGFTGAGWVVCRPASAIASSRTCACISS